MAERILITGGMGFIGRHVSRKLLERGAEVRVLDNFNPQVHGPDPDRTAPEGVELIVGDVRDGATVARALKGADKVVHLAAEVGVGQSMYEIARYVGVNELGTAVLMQELLAQPVRRLVTASSMSIYGEGLYRTAGGELVETAERRAGGSGWDPVDPTGTPMTPAPTPEWKRPSLASVYALGKYAQEQLTLITGRAYGIESAALRLFNVYGPGQALSNPYTGVLAIFASRILNGNAPMIFEDGEQRRDFVHVDDVAEAFVLALEHEAAPGEVFNVGSGEEITVAGLAQRFLDTMQRPDLSPEITGKARTGDIRHCFADISKAREQLGFEPRRNLDEGLAELADWVATQESQDRVGDARRELEERGLVA